MINGVPNFEPGRNVSRAEALVAIMRTLRENGVNTGETDGSSCTPPVAVPSNLSWVNCSLTAASKLGYVPPFASNMSAPATREDIAVLMSHLMGKYFPVEGSAQTASGFTDDNTKNTDVLGSVGTMVENQIMIGRNPEVWGFGQPITRAELAAVIERVRTVLSVAVPQ